MIATNALLMPDLGLDVLECVASYLASTSRVLMCLPANVLTKIDSWHGPGFWSDVGVLLVSMILSAFIARGPQRTFMSIRHNLCRYAMTCPECKFYPDGRVPGRFLYYLCFIYCWY